MLQDDDLEEALRIIINNVMLALYHEGITHINLGGLMRIIGVPNKKAAQYDNDMVIMDANFVKHIETFNSPRPPDQPLH